MVTRPGGHAGSGPVREAEPEEAHARIDGGRAVLIDVRSEDEFAAAHAPGSANLPLPRIVSGSVDVPAGRTIYLICRSGSRSASAAAVLAARGRADVVNVRGGMIAWEAAGLPVERAAGPAGGLLRRLFGR